MSSNKSNSTNSFLIQGSILAFAGILVRLIGLIYRIPLNNILGLEGAGYYSTAYDIYSILLLLSSQSMPIAVSKIVSSRLAKDEYKNAHKVFKGALIYGIIAGVIFGSIAYFGADWLAAIFKYPSAARALRVLAPTLVIVSIIGVFRGYFQGIGSMGPTAISQVFEQIVNAIVSIVAAYQLFAYGSSIEAVSEKAMITNASSWGAAGGTLGTCMGALAAFIILLFVYIRYKDGIRENIPSDKASKNESYAAISKVIIFTITPVLLSTTIYQIGNLIDNAVYSNLMQNVFSIEESIRSSIWSVYSSRYKLFTTMPIAIATALSLSIVPSIVRSFTAGDKEVVIKKIETVSRFSMIIALPCGIGLSVLGGPINVLLYPNSGYKELIGLTMIFSVFTVVAFSLSTISNAILQGIDKLKIPIYNSAISLAVHFILLPILLVVFKLDIYGVVIGDFTFAMMVCVLNARSIKKYLGYKQEIKNTFIKPGICSLIMGVFTVLTYYGMNYVLIRVTDKTIIANDISVLVSIAVAVVVYAIVLLKTKTLTETELEGFPKGNTLINICKKFHLI